MYFYLKKTKSKKPTLILLRYHIDQEQGKFVYSTGEHILPVDWDFENKYINLKRGRSDLAATGRKLQKYNNLLNKLLPYYTLNDIKITKERLKADFDKEFKNEVSKEIKTINRLIDLYIETKTKASKMAPATKKKYTNLKNKLEDFEIKKKRNLKFNNFRKDSDFIENWLDYCYNMENHTDNTVGRSFGFIKTILLFGKNKGLHDLDLSHLKKFSQETDDVALTKDELLTYYNYDFKGNKKLEKARDIFCIGCFTGQRYSDYSVFNKTDYINGNIEKRAQKTRNKSIIPVDANPKLKFLLEKYDWNLPKISDQKFRDYIKEGLKKTEALDYNIKKVSYQGTKKIESIIKKHKAIGSHTARRTFITLALEDGWTYKEIMTVAGIKEVSTVIKYDKVNAERLNRKIKLTFG